MFITVSDQNKWTLIEEWQNIKHGKKFKKQTVFSPSMAGKGCLAA